MTLHDWFTALRPAPLAIDGRERLRVVLGALLGLGLVALASHALLGAAAGPALPWLVAPLGASTVLVFGVPASPLAQPWSVLGGNTVSTLVALACMAVLPWPAWWLAGLAVALAIAAMITLRCLHPPGGAAALLVVLAGVQDWRFALAPVALNSLLLVLTGMAWNSATGRPYPHRQAAAPRPMPATPPSPQTPQTTSPVAMPSAAAPGPAAAPSASTTGSAARPAPEPALPPASDLGPARFTEADLDAVLARYNQVVDLPRDDLRRLLEEAELQAYRRHMGTLRCADIMSAPARTVAFGTPLAEAWTTLHEDRIKALPVVDRWGHVVGIVTQADFLRSADLLGALPTGDEGAAPDPAGLPARLRRLLAPTPGMTATKPEVVGQIMSRQVRVVSADRPVGEVVLLFAATGHHHIPVIGADKRIVGILTQTDLVAALVRLPEAGHA